MKITLALAFIFALTICSYAQPEAEVAKAVENLRVAIIDAKKDALEKIAADELTYGHSSGLIEGKKEFVEALVSGKSDFIRIAVADQVIKVAGDAATVRHKLTGDVVNSGVASQFNISVLLVWIKKKGEWKLLARQAIKN